MSRFEISATNLRLAFLADARHVQIAALSTLFALSNVWSDFGAGLAGFAAAFAGALSAQALGARWRSEAFEWRSALVTTLGVSILLRAAYPGFWFAAAFIGIGAKFLIRWRGKHIYNPANLGVVLMILAGGGAAWISPGQWGQASWIAGLMIGFGALVLSCARRLDIAIAFFGTYASLLIARALYLGDPLAIPLHQMQTGALLVFTFFMITDPRATPDSRFGRILLAVAVAGLAYHLQFKMQMRPGLLFALAALSPLTILLDRLMPAQRFNWSHPKVGEPPHVLESPPRRARPGDRPVHVR
jgi:Na+-transporting NADH:ubiquinone oxidoreductase subunit NqrB